jgi:PhzF family phenazine biosynthesis protein
MRIYQVDAFADQPFRGNPAGVCLLDASQPDTWMQSLAQEMNLSETAFLLKQSDGFNLRWFTPKREVSLCGHATLATAHILWKEHILDPGAQANFHTQSGLLTARKDSDYIEMDFPARFADQAEANAELNRALGTVPICTSKSTAAKGTGYLVEVESEQVVRDLAPDFKMIAALGIRFVIVTSRAQSKEYDFVSRYFAPAAGIDEDPVTGSAHCYLAPYWANKLKKTALVGFQASARIGIVGCTWKDDRVVLRGQAVTVFKGEVMV